MRAYARARAMAWIGSCMEPQAEETYNYEEEKKRTMEDKKT